MTYKIEFCKNRKGQQFFSRTISEESLTLLLMLCDDIKITVTGSNKGSAVFTFHKNDMVLWGAIKNLKFYQLRKLLPPEEWENGLPGR